MIRIVSAAVLTVLASAASAADIDPLPYLDSGYREVELGRMGASVERSIVEREILPGLARESGDAGPYPFEMALFDLDGDELPELVVRILAPRHCGAGCLTLVYSYSDGAWRLVQEARSAMVLARDGRVVFLAPDTAPREVRLPVRTP